MAKRIAIYSLKGGVGKTTIAANLAYSAAVLSSLKVLLWDIDAQGAVSFLFGQDRAEGKAKRVFSRDVAPAALIAPTRWPGLDLLAADLSLRHLDQTFIEADRPKRLRKLLQSLAPAYDSILLDCPPGLGEVSDQLFRAVDLIVLPVPPGPLALRALELIATHLERNHERKPQLLPVVSMADRRKSLHRDFIAAHPDWPVIPHASIVERMAVERAPLASYARSSAAAEAFAGLWSQIELRLAAPSGAKESSAGKTLARIPKPAR